MKKITFIGAGNVASVLSSKLRNKGFEIVEILSKTEKSARDLALKLDCNFTTNLNDLQHTDLFVIAVKDDFIKETVHLITDKETPIVHTSGCVGIDIFSNKNNSGVFYPLQTFNKEIEMDFENLPICIESNNPSLASDLIDLANSITTSVHKLNSEQRKKIHIAAVFACNFSNHMLSISEDIMKKNNMDFSLLKPLIEMTFQKIKNNSPKDMQTGPAFREDEKVMEEHLKQLENRKAFKELYSKISESIINFKDDE